MEKQIYNSIIAENNSSITKSTIKGKNSDLDIVSGNSVINSIVADKGSQVSNVTLIMKREKRKSFWEGFWGGIIVSIIGGGVWYLIQTTLL